MSDIQAQFILEYPASLRSAIEARKQEWSSALCLCLLTLFGLPLDTPVNLRARYTDRFSLTEANSPHFTQPSRTPHPKEVSAVIMALTFALLDVGSRNDVYLDLNGERTPDA